MIKTEEQKIIDAAHMWVAEFNAYPQGIWEKLMEYEPNSITELTRPSIGDQVYYDGDEYEIDKRYKNGNFALKPYNGGRIISAKPEDCELISDCGLPMWGTMWSFGSNLDDDWLESHLDEMSACGFRIYEHEDFGYFFGIDGAGYDFYESHWVPLYKARGLQWHKYE